MSPKFAHSSKSVYLLPVSHANKFHNLLYYDINLHGSAILGRHCEQIGSHCAWLSYEISGSKHCNWLVHHFAGYVSWRIMKSAHILAEYALCTLYDIATMVGSVSFCKVHAQRSDYCIHPRCKLVFCSHVWCTVLQLEQSSSKMHGYIHAIHCV